jgi:Sec-independent protein secretion pathway component TatC
MGDSMMIARLLSWLALILTIPTAIVAIWQHIHPEIHANAEILAFPLIAVALAQILGAKRQ